MTDGPTRIGRYTVEREIGRGGAGVVYLASDDRLGREVALKALPATERAEREARALAALRHPNVAAIHGIEEDGGARYLVLEYVDGRTLAERLALGPLRTSEVLEVGSGIAAGLAAAHDAGIVHRDLKPANVKIDAKGTVRILDFGLARVRGDAPPSPSDATVTLPGTVLGTAPYMSPEQARGEPVDRRGDLWSLGVVLFECLTGHNPFLRPTVAESLVAILSERVDLDALPPTTPPELALVIRRCLEPDATRRLRDAHDVRVLLDDVTARRAHSAGSAGTAAIAEGRFRIDDTLCRTLDRDGFDSLLPGWEMRYADNGRDSDTLIVWIPSIGGDHRTFAWRDLMSATPHRLVTVCPVGMEPGVEHRPVVTMANQLALIRALTADLRARLAPRHTIVSGFGCGSTMGLRCAAGDDGGGRFDGVLTIDADLQESDCFISRLFAGLDPSSSDDVVRGLARLSGSCRTVREWLSLHQHTVECIDKVQHDLTPLIAQGRDLSEPYEGVHSAEDSPFVGYLRDAVERVAVVRCVFHDSAETRRLVGGIRLMHMDRGVLGPGFRDEMLQFIPDTDHTGMMDNACLLDLLDGIVDEVRSARDGERAP